MILKHSVLLELLGWSSWSPMPFMKNAALSTRYVGGLYFFGVLHGYSKHCFSFKCYELCRFFIVYLVTKIFPSQNAQKRYF